MGNVTGTQGFKSGSLMDAGETRADKFVSAALSKKIHGIHV
jgi:hypothetical protein